MMGFFDWPISRSTYSAVRVFGPQSALMFGLFKKKDPLAELKKEAARLEEEAYQLSRTDRKAADLKTAEAAELWKKIEKLQHE
jgi:hypothetical protein